MRTVSNIKALGFTWQTRDPFLFCVHHKDDYPAGNGDLGPAASLAGRDLGQDFTQKDGWRMYHGERIPGFPSHPHRGFETVTVVLEGFVDHSDSHGSAGRYGNGDVQWMTAGSGLQHSEMFPLLHRDRPNPLELFQIWLNLPGRKKFCPPYYTMLWSGDIPRYKETDGEGRTTEVTLIAGKLGQTQAPDPSPDSWAFEKENEVAIWIIRMEPRARWTLPGASSGMNRSLYFYGGESLRVDRVPVPFYHSADLSPDRPMTVENGDREASLLLLQGRPIGEPVVSHGPFVMNTANEIREAYGDFQKTRFGGWPWERDDNVHDRDKGRFARYADGRNEEKPQD